MNNRPQRYLRLLAWTIFTSTIWLWVLPQVARLESVDRHLRLLDERRIDASAMFYTELEDRPITSRLAK